MGGGVAHLVSALSTGGPGIAIQPSHTSNSKNSGPEWFISSMIYSRDIPFWYGTLDIGTLLATRSDALRFGVSGRTGWQGAGILKMGEKASLTCAFYLSVARRLGGQVVKASTSRAADPGFDSRLGWDFSGSSHRGDFKIATPVATLPGAWRDRVSDGTGWPGVRILWLGEIEK